MVDTKKAIVDQVVNILLYEEMVFTPGDIGYLYERSCSLKAELNEWLGLGEHNGYRRQLCLSTECSEQHTRALRPKVTALLTHMVQSGYITDFSLSEKIVRVRSGKAKLGKFLRKTIPKFLDDAVMDESLLRSRVWVVSDALYEMAGTKLYGASVVATFYNEWSEGMLPSAVLKKTLACVGGLDGILPRFLELLTISGSLTVSTNLLDFVTASYNSTYSSCYAIKGAYFAGTLANALSPCHFMIYVTPDDVESPGYLPKKIGRAWGFLYRNSYLRSGPLVLGFLTPYGSLGRDLLSDAARALLTEIGGDSDLLEVEDGDASPKFSDYYPGYLDATEVAFSTSYLRRGPDPPILDGDGFCLKCGRDGMIESEEMSLCHLCIAEHTCGHCGELVNEDLIDVDDERWCSGCANGDANECPHCGVYYANSNEPACPDCIVSHYVSCNKCWHFIHIDDAVEINDLEYCPECAKELREEEVCVETTTSVELSV